MYIYIYIFKEKKEQEQEEPNCFPGHFFLTRKFSINSYTISRKSNKIYEKYYTELLKKCSQYSTNHRYL